jgi:hypothetical protein
VRGRLREARAALRRWRESASARSAIDGLLSRASPAEPFEARLLWLAGVVAWVARPGRIEDEAASPARPPQVTRLRHLLNVLDRNPEWKARAARALRATLREMDSLELYCETGLPREPGFWREATERWLRRLLPADPGRDLGRLLLSAFPDEGRIAWLERLDEETLARLAALLSFELGEGEAEGNPLRRDMPDALVYLVSEVASVGLSTPFRRRIGAASFRDLPFYGLARAAEDVARAVRGGDPPALDDGTARLGERLAGCRRAMAAVHAHLDQHGVSTRIVYQLERMEAQIRRAEALLGRLSEAGGAPAAAAAFARLVRDTVESTRLAPLVERNSRLLARKVVDRSAETGAHYIARNRSEYLAMLRSAAGGGLVTAATAWIKLGISVLKAPAFVEGVLASLNYAASFVFLQLAHFTLATKQPAMTGPALARRLEHADEPGGADAFADEVLNLLRSQAASIFGNLATVAGRPRGTVGPRPPPAADRQGRGHARVAFPGRTHPFLRGPDRRLPLPLQPRRGLGRRLVRPARARGRARREPPPRRGARPWPRRAARPLAARKRVRPRRQRLSRLPSRHDARPRPLPRPPPRRPARHPLGRLPGRRGLGPRTARPLLERRRLGSGRPREHGALECRRELRPRPRHRGPGPRPPRPGAVLAAGRALAPGVDPPDRPGGARANLRALDRHGLSEQSNRLDQYSTG